MTQPIDIGRGFEQRITKKLNDWWHSQDKKGSFERRGLGKKGLPDITCPPGLNWCISCKAEKWGLWDLSGGRDTKGKVHRWRSEINRALTLNQRSVLVTTYQRRIYVIAERCPVLEYDPFRYSPKVALAHNLCIFRLNDFLEAMKVADR